MMYFCCIYNLKLEITNSNRDDGILHEYIYVYLIKNCKRDRKPNKGQLKNTIRRSSFNAWQIIIGINHSFSRYARIIYYVDWYHTKKHTMSLAEWYS